LSVKRRISRPHLNAKQVKKEKKTGGVFINISRKKGFYGNEVGVNK